MSIERFIRMRMTLFVKNDVHDLLFTTSWTTWCILYLEITNTIFNKAREINNT